jgi:hypothetical protein
MRRGGGRRAGRKRAPSRRRTDVLPRAKLRKQWPGGLPTFAAADAVHVVDDLSQDMALQYTLQRVADAGVDYTQVSGAW